jgi:hypothetical protein
MRRGGLRADRCRPSVTRRARPTAGRGGGGRTGFEVAGAADLELVAVGARGFGAGAALALGARGSGHSVYAAGPVGVLVPEPVGSGVGAGVRAFGFCADPGVGVRFAFRFGVIVRFAFRFGVIVRFAFRVTVGVLFAVGFSVAVAFTVCFVVTV